MDNKSFRVIIIGGGPVGLYLAHTLALAQIDYILLERQASVLNKNGHLIFIWPQTVRLLDQIGVHEQLREVAIPLHAKKRIDGITGGVMTNSHFWESMEENHGYAFLPLLRPDLVRILYGNLPDKETRVRTSAEVVDIQTTANGVRVYLHDQTVLRGAIVIGADGVHSRTRSLMQTLLKRATGVAVDIDPMVANFHGIFGRASNEDLGIEQAVLLESRGSGSVIQCTATREIVHFVTLTPLPVAAAGRRGHQATLQEMEAHAALLADIAVCPGVQFGDIWRRADKNTARKLNQEEGFLTCWHHDRIVLVGDAVHKGTSVNGLGLTCGLHSAAALANELQHLLATSPTNPSTVLLDGAFRRYQRTRETEANQIWCNGRAMIRQVTAVSWMAWFWDHYILPWVDIERFGWGLLVSLLLIRHGHILLYVPFEGRQGSVRWTRQPKLQM